MQYSEVLEISIVLSFVSLIYFLCQFDFLHEWLHYFIRRLKEEKLCCLKFGAYLTHLILMVRFHQLDLFLQLLILFFSREHFLTEFFCR